VTPNIVPANQVTDHAKRSQIFLSAVLGRSDCASVLQQNLDEEKATDSKLNAMALRSVNRKAA
jgi:ferritin-like metal-binding protein YciE